MEQVHAAQGRRIAYAADKRAQARGDWTKPPNPEDAGRLYDETPISARQIQILELVANGRTNVEVAAELHLSPETIKTHMRNVLAKMQARSRAHAVHLAHEQGLLTTRSPGRSSGPLR